MKNFIAAVKGVSGSGKSTRTFLLLSFLEKIGLETEDFMYKNFEGKTKPVGTLIKDLDLIFIGKKYKTGDFERFQGYDAVTGVFGKSALFSEFLKDISPNYSVIVEGAGVTMTNRLRPLFLYEFCGFNNVMMQYYNYGESQKEEYLGRITYRSGKPPSKNAMWEKNSGFEAEIRHCATEIALIKDKGYDFSPAVFHDLYDAETYDFGVKFLAFFQMENFISDFIDYCNSSNYITQNSFNFHSNGK